MGSYLMVEERECRLAEYDNLSWREVKTMRFLKQQAGTAVVEWLVAIILVLAVVGTVILSVANTTSTEGTKTDTWINGAGSLP